MPNQISFRRATREDVPAIVGLLADDELGKLRECNTDPLPASYYTSFELIDSDPLNELVVACAMDVVVGVFQLTFLPYLTHQGSLRALIEGVRVASSHRSQGLGQAMLEWAIQRARDRGCAMVQLTTDKARPDALRFYQRLGFAATHEGMKLSLMKS